MTKLIKVFVFTFVFFAVYFSLEQLAFKNTIFAVSEKRCCENAQCYQKQCSYTTTWGNVKEIEPVEEKSSKENIPACTIHVTGICRTCIDYASSGSLCGDNILVNYYCKDKNDNRYYGLGSDGSPSAPQGLTTSWVNGNEETGNPRIDWAINPEIDVVHYEVWKRIDNYISPDIDWFVKANVTATDNNYYIDNSETGWGTMGPPRDVYYKVKAVDYDNNKSSYSSTVSFLCDDDNFYKKNISDGEQKITQYKNYLGNNYPNPFNPTTTISYSIAKQIFVEVVVYDILGKEIIKLVNEVQNKGKHVIKFNASGLPSGTYYYKIITNGFTDTRMMKLIK